MRGSDVAARGQIAITAQDFEFLPENVSSPDQIILGDEPGTVLLKKKIGNKFYVVKELKTGRKKLMVKPCGRLLPRQLHLLLRSPPLKRPKRSASSLHMRKAI